MKLNIFGKTVIVKNSDRPNKQKVVIINNKKVYFGDPNMKEYPGTKRGDNYCTRSLGIAKKYNIENDVNSPNFWSRWLLWNCKGNKSFKKRPKL